jgi:hypothetical protein
MTVSLRRSRTPHWDGGASGFYAAFYAGTVVSATRMAGTLSGSGFENDSLTFDKQ